jgi:hypothetical protein
MIISVCCLAMLSDMDAGVIADFGNTIRAETVDDLLDQARGYHNQSTKEGAGVLATAVFEDTVRRLARTTGIAEVGVKTDQIISELDKRQAITGILAKRHRVAAGPGGSTQPCAACSVECILFRGCGRCDASDPSIAH